jgi:hypothetical protein
MFYDGPIESRNPVEIFYSESGERWLRYSTAPLYPPQAAPEPKRTHPIPEHALSQWRGKP